MKLSVFALLVLLSINTAKGQFPNPDFEEYLQCPSNMGQFDNYVSLWKNYNFPATLDYHNTCDFTGNASLSGGASSGNGSVGIWTMPTGNNCTLDAYVEILQANLWNPLTANTTYDISVDLRVDNVGTASGPPNDCLDFGFYFYNNSSPPSTANAPCTISVIPQVSINHSQIPAGTYQTFHFAYTASGNENAVLIGSFKNNNTAYCTQSDKMYINMDNLHMIVSGIDEPSPIPALSIQPNPNNGQFMLKIDSPKPQSMQLQLVNTLGQTVYSERLGLISRSFQKQLNFTDLPKSVYILKLKSEEGIVTSKITLR